MYLSTYLSSLVNELAKSALRTALEDLLKQAFLNENRYTSARIFLRLGIPISRPIFFVQPFQFFEQAVFSFQSPWSVEPDMLIFTHSHIDAHMRQCRFTA